MGPSQPSCLSPPAVPRGGGQAGVSECHQSDSRTSGRDGGGGPSSPKMGVAELGVRTLRSGKRREHQVSGWFSADLPLLKDHPFSFPLWGLGSSGALGTLQEEGRGAAALAGGRACHPPVLLGPHTQFPTSALPLPSFQGREQASPAAAGSLACVPVRVLVATSPTSPCFVLLVALLQQWDASKEGVQSEATTPLTRERRGRLKLPGQGP